MDVPSPRRGPSFRLCHALVLPRHRSCYSLCLIYWRSCHPRSAGRGWCRGHPWKCLLLCSRSCCGFRAHPRNSFCSGSGPHPRRCLHPRSFCRLEYFGQLFEGVALFVADCCKRCRWLWIVKGVHKLSGCCRGGLPGQYAWHLHAGRGKLDSVGGSLCPRLRDKNAVSPIVLECRASVLSVDTMRRPRRSGTGFCMDDNSRARRC